MVRASCTINKVYNKFITVLGLVVCFKLHILYFVICTVVVVDESFDIALLLIFKRKRNIVLLDYCNCIEC